MLLMDCYDNLIMEMNDLHSKLSELEGRRLRLEDDIVNSIIDRLAKSSVLLRDVSVWANINQKEISVKLLPRVTSKTVCKEFKITGYKLRVTVDGNISQPEKVIEFIVDKMTSILGEGECDGV